MTKIYWQITDKLTGQTHKEVKNEDIYRYAFININKHGNGGKTCKTNLQIVMKNDGELLKKQIDYLSPDLIVCGAFGSQALQDCKDYFNKEIIKKPTKKIPPVIYSKHFSVVSYNEILEQVTPEMINTINKLKNSTIAQ